MTTTKAKKEPSVADEVTGCYTAIMSEVSAVDDKKEAMIASINDCLAAGKAHLPRLFDSVGGIRVNGDTPAFKIDENVVLAFSGEQVVAMLLVNPKGADMMETPRYEVAKSEEIAEKYGDKQFGKMICDALNKIRQHYKAINDSHLKPEPPAQSLYEDVTKEINGG